MAEQQNKIEEQQKIAGEQGKILEELLAAKKVTHLCLDNAKL